MEIVFVLAGLLALAIAGVLIAAASRPGTFRVRRWAACSPWEKKDPGMKRTFGERMYAWEGNRDVGKGSMRITSASENSSVRLALDFEKPFAAHNTVDFTLTPGAGGTEVVWSMQGPVPFFAKIVHLFIDMDAMVGKDFEAGLANLKKAAEGQ